MASRKKPVDPEAKKPIPPPALEGLERASDAEIRPVPWLMRGAVPDRCYTLIQGRKGTGKSTLVSAVVASMTGGPPVPGWVGPTTGRVVWCGEERMWGEVVVPRLAAAGSNVGLVHRLSETRPDGRKGRYSLPDDLDALRDLLTRAQVRLLVLDPISRLVSPGLDLGQPQQGRLFADCLNDLAWECSLSVLATQHIKKGNIGDPLDAGYGSGELVNCARSVLRADHHPHEDGIRVLAVVAGNISQPMPTQAFTIVDAGREQARVRWHGEVDLDADTIAEGRGNEAERDEWHDADRMLALMIGEGWVRVDTIQEASLRAGITPRMLRRAKARLGIPSRQKMVGADHYWEWGHPANGWPPGLLLPEGSTPPSRTHGAPGENGAPEPPEKPAKKARRPRRPRASATPLAPPPEAPSEETTHDPTTD